MKARRFLFVLAAAGLLITACGESESQATGVPAPTIRAADTPTSVPTAAPAATAQPDTEEQAAAEPSGFDAPNSEDIVLEIVNATELEICDIAITRSRAEELGDNILDEVLLPGDGLSYTDFETGLYDLLAFDCREDEGEVVAEVYDVQLGIATVVWRIGETIAGDEARTGGQAPGSAQFSGPSRAANCPFDVPVGLALDCGALTVPENRTKPDSPDIELAVAILRAPGPDVQPDPIVYLAGGPGSSALADFIAEPEGWIDYPFSRQRDLIFIDQRGAGYSTPTLNCTELEAEEPDEKAELDCRDRLLAAGIDLSAYNTAENAADIAALAEALNYESWNLLGISYGTRLALVVMRDHPQGVRSVVLDSPFPPNAATAEDESINTMEAFRLLFDDCAGDPNCSAAFPDLEGVLLETVARLNEAPDAEIYGDDLVGTIEQAMKAGEEFIVMLPMMIYQVAEDDFELYEELAADLNWAEASAKFQGEEDRSDSEGMYNSVMCRDEYAFGDPDLAEQLALAEIPDEFFPAMFSTTEGMFETCAEWDAGAAVPLENEPVISDIPTLIMVGEYDPATPPKWGRLTADTLGNAYYFEFPGSGHSLLSDTECAIQATDEFFDDPTREPDRSCLDEMSGPLFEAP
jgi:pimeloyl-ACP methyl ester carboxylesterase